MLLGEGVFGFGLCECGCGEKTNIAKRSRKQFGINKGQPYRFVRGHGLKEVRGEPTMGYVIEDRRYETPCFVWLGNVSGRGYGIFGEGTGESYRKIYAHRRAYEASKGEIPEGLEIDHLCRVHACVNPEHLEAVTHAENVRRGYAARRAV
jgi:hypothetical protein